MQNKKIQSGHEERSQPLGICQRLFNFLVTNMLPRGIRRLTQEMPRGNETDQMLIEDPTRVVKNTNRVSFKDLETWTPVDGMGSSILLPEKARRGSEKEVPLMDSDGNYNDRRVHKRKERRSYNLAPTERLILPVDPDDDVSEVFGSRLRPLFSVETNINEKSSDFIQRRKEAMRRNMEP